MCCEDTKEVGKAPFEVDNPRFDGEFKADIYNAEPGYDTFGIVFEVLWSDDSTNELKGNMWLDSWSSPRYTYHQTMYKKDKNGVVLGVKSLTVSPDFAVSSTGEVWGNRESLKDFLLQKELYLRGRS